MDQQDLEKMEDKMGARDVARYDRLTPTIQCITRTVKSRKAWVIVYLHSR